MKQPFTQVLLAELRRRGSATTKELHEAFPDKSMREILDALGSNRQQKRVRLIARGCPMNNGTSTSGLWGMAEQGEPAPKAASNPAQGIVRVSSVWGLASGPVAILALPGRVCCPLGPWKDAP